MSLAAVLATIYGLKQIAEHGITLVPVVAIGVGVAIAVLFVRRQRRLADPMIDLRFFSDRAFTASLVVYGMGTFVAFGAFVFIGQYLQLVLGMSALVAGLWTTPFAAAFILGALVTPRLADRMGAARVITAGLWLATAGFVILATVGVTQNVLWFVTGFTVYALGLAPVFTLATDLIVGCAPPEHAGAASAISETASELGGALGIALLGSLGAAIYRAGLAGVAIPGIAADAMEPARATLGAAIDLAQRLPGASGSALAAAADAAFIDGMRASAIAAALVVAAMAWLTAEPLRHARTSDSVEA